MYDCVCLSSVNVQKIFTAICASASLYCKNTSAQLGYMYYREKEDLDVLR